MMRLPVSALLAIVCSCGVAVAAEHDYYKTLWWVRPHEPEKEAQFRQGSIEFAENMWSHIEVAGSTMPYWR